MPALQVVMGLALTIVDMALLVGITLLMEALFTYLCKKFQV